jgi:Bacterial SH3 domain
MKLKAPFAAFFIALVTTFVVAQEKYVKPQDEGAKDPSFAAFRTKLIAAAERKDPAYLLSIVDPKIKNGFGGQDGIANFKREWKITSKNSKFWAEFVPVIKNGGKFEDGGRSFMVPYTFSHWPDDVDGFEYHAIFGNNVNLRKQPDLKADVVAQLSYNVVELQPETVPKSGKSEYLGWYLVKTLGGLEGYVREEYVRSHIDYRAGFEKIRGKWRMTFFLAGD